MQRETQKKPELGRLRLALVGERLLDVVSGVELGLLLLDDDGGILLGVNGEFAAIFGLDSPETALVVHLGARDLADSRDELRITALLLRRHCSSLRVLWVCGIAHAGEGR